MSRIDDLKKQNPELDISLIDLISIADPSKSNKYISFLINYLKNDLDKTLSPDEIKTTILNAIYGKNLDLLKRFEEHCVSNRIKDKDISKFKKFSDFKEQINDADEVLRVKMLEKQIIKLFDSSEYLVLIPLSYEASRTYGANTKWCVTDIDSWEEYFGKYRLIFIINKKTNVKHAVSQEHGDMSNIQCFNQEDHEIEFLTTPLPNDVFGCVRTELMKGTYQTEFEKLGSEVIISKDRGVVSIDNATADELDDFLDCFNNFVAKDNFGFELPDEFLDRLQGKIDEEENDADEDNFELSDESLKTIKKKLEDNPDKEIYKSIIERHSELSYFDDKKSIFNQTISVAEIFNELGMDGMHKLIKLTHP